MCPPRTFDPIVVTLHRIPCPAPHSERWLWLPPQFRAPKLKPLGYKVVVSPPAPLLDLTATPAHPIRGTIR